MARDLDEPTREIAGADITVPEVSGAARPVVDAGRRLGRYVVLDRLGAGAMGVVYRAFDPQLDRRVAIKLVGLSPGIPREIAEASRARLLREAKALAQVSHPNVVAVHDVGVLDDDVFIAMELVEGDTLRRWVEKESPSWTRVLDALLAAARGLAVAHAEGLVHRDVKPDNIMVGADGRVRVMDFGLARPGATDLGDAASPSSDLAVDDLSVTRTGFVVGTPAYMPLEQFRGQDVDARGDQFSWCVTAWEMLHGERPFAGRGADAIEAAIERGRRRPPPDDTRVPTWVREILERGLAADAADRWPDLPALVAAVERGRRAARRRPWLGAMGLVVVGVTGGIAWRTTAARAERRRCDDAAEAIGSVWPGEDSAVAGELEAAITSPGTEVSERVGARATALFDTWADGWRDARRQTCLYEVEGQWDEALRARADDCLGEAKLQARTLLDELSGAGARALFHGISAAAELAPATRCADPDHLRRRPTAPPDADDAVAAVRERLARVDASEAAGSPVASYADAVDAALAEAEAIGWAPLVADARLTVAGVRDQQARPDEAEEVFVAVYRDAAASDDAEHEFAAARALCALLAARPGRSQEALVWCYAAEAALGRAWDPTSIRRADWLLAMARSLDAVGDHERSRGVAEESLLLLRAAWGDASAKLATAHGEIARLAFQAGDPERAREHLRQERAILEAAVGDKHPRIASSINNFAVLATSTGDWDSALAAFDEARVIREEAYGPDHPEVAMSYSNIGQVYLAQGRYDEAVEALEHAVAIEERAYGPDAPELASSLTGLGNALFDGNADGDPDRNAAAAAVYERALALRRKTPNVAPDELAGTLYNLSRVRGIQGRQEAELDLLREAVELCERGYGDSDPRCGVFFNGLAHALLNAGETVPARPWFQRAIDVLEDAPMDGHFLVNARFGLARALWDTPSERARARTLAEAALADAGDYVGPRVDSPEEIQAWLDAHPAPTKR